MTGAILPLLSMLPQGVYTFSTSDVQCTKWKAYGCVMFGLWSGLAIGFITEYYTSNQYAPV